VRYLNGFFEIENLYQPPHLLPRLTFTRASRYLIELRSTATAVDVEQLSSYNPGMLFVERHATLENSNCDSLRMTPPPTTLTTPPKPTTPTTTTTPITSAIPIPAGAAAGPATRQ